MRPPAVAFGLLAFAAGCSGGNTARLPDLPPELHVAAAADLKFAFEEVLTAFRAKYPNQHLAVTYGSSGQFHTQISTGSWNAVPYDLFLSADVDYPRKLIEQERAVKGSEFVYAVGRLVVWVPKGSPLDVEKLGIKAVAEPGVRKVAIANPRHAPYGRAAEAALKHAKLYEQVSDKLVLGENVAQAAQFADSGAADVGIFALSLAMAPTMRDRGRYVEVSPDAYPPLNQAGVILTRGQYHSGAKALRDFLTGDEGRAILKRYGFGLPEK